MGTAISGAQGRCGGRSHAAGGAGALRGAQHAAVLAAGGAGALRGAQPRCARTGGGVAQGRCGGRRGAAGGAGALRGAQGRCGGRRALRGAQPRCARTGGGGRRGAAGGAGALRGAQGRCGGRSHAAPVLAAGGAGALRGGAGAAAPGWRVFRPILFGGSFAFDHAAEQIALGDDSNHAIPFDDRDAADAVAEQELRNRNNWLVGSNSDNGMSHKIAQGKICSAVIKIVFSHIVGMRGVEMRLISPSVTIPVRRPALSRTGRRRIRDLCINRRASGRVIVSGAQIGGWLIQSRTLSILSHT
jgi:hypothetical protein